MVTPKTAWDSTEISNERVRRAMEKVARPRFVPEELTDKACADKALPIGRGQTISQPTVVAAMTAALDPQPEQRVLEVGTGSGYQTAILAELFHSVYTIEIDPALSEDAVKRLRELRYHNVYPRVGDGYHGWIEEAPFDAIIVTAAVDDVPPPLMDQLKDGGRLVIPLGTPSGSQELKRVEKHGRDITTKTMMPVRFVSFRRHLSR